jgi:hypothetical protein
MTLYRVGAEPLRKIWRRDAPGVIACSGTERAFVRAPDSTNKTEDQRTYSAGSTGCLVATRAGCLPSVTAAVRCGAMSLIFPTGGPSPASSSPGTGSCPKAAGAAIAGRDTTDPRYPDPQPGIASSFGLLARPGAGISRGWCLLMGLVPLPPHLAR